jgi:hypothetical protein
MSKIKIIVSSRLQGGHRRGGRLWPQNQVEAEVDEQQLAELKADEHLVLLELPSNLAEALTRQAEKE